MSVLSSEAQKYIGISERLDVMWNLSSAFVRKLLVGDWHFFIGGAGD
jgi:hypothetical protein